MDDAERQEILQVLKSLMTGNRTAFDAFVTEYRATFMTACDEAIDEADALLTSIAETVEFSSFNPAQRASLAQWHSGVKESRIALRK